MTKVVKLSMIGATGAVMFLAVGGAAYAGPVGLADAAKVAPPAATESVHYRSGRSAYMGRSAHYCPPRRVEHRTVYVNRIIERRTAYIPRTRYIIERRTAYVAAPVATAVAVPVVAVAYPGGGYGGGGGLLGAGAGLIGGALNIGFGGGGWGGPGWGGGWGGGWRRGGWW
jgi:hypothetical protein